MRVAEFTTWSPTLGCEATRISTADSLGQEYFAILPRTEGRAWREARQQAVEALAEAMERGLTPGEVRWR